MFTYYGIEEINPFSGVWSIFSNKDSGDLLVYSKRDLAFSHTLFSMVIHHSKQANKKKQQGDVEF